MPKRSPPRQICYWKRHIFKRQDFQSWRGICGTPSSLQQTYFDFPKVVCLNGNTGKHVWTWPLKKRMQKLYPADCERQEMNDPEEITGSPCNPPKAALRIWPLSKGVKFILFASRLSLNNLLSLPSQLLQWNLQTLVVPSITMERTYTSYWNDYGTFRQLGSFTKMLSLFWLCIYCVAGLL